jgi:hypothetical protein
MAWPQDPLPIRTELYLDGAWADTVDSEPLVERVLGAGRISITRGMIDQQSTLAPQTCDFTLKNADGLFSNRNPNSPLFGKFTQNTLVRMSVEDASGGLDSHLLAFRQTGGSYASTTDKAALDITGDIEVRFEVTPESWRPEKNMVIGGKYAITGNQRSWHVRLTSDGIVQLVWTADGSTILGISPTLSDPIPEDSGRLAVRITFDVNDGGGNRVGTFYTGPAITGPWTTLATVTTAGTTSIFSGTAPLEVGTTNAGTSAFSVDIPFSGKIHGFRVYNAIGGTLVADFDPSTQDPGATSWTDTTGTANTWTVTTGDFGGRVASDRVRFIGEIGGIPQRWDTTGQDVQVPVRASGALRRLLQGGQPIRSSIYRHLIQYSTINGYWPMEAESGATLVDSAVPQNRSSVADASFSGSTPDGLAGSAGAMTLNSTNSRVYLYSPGRASTGEASFLCYFKLNAAPASEAQLISVRGNATASHIDIKISSTTYRFDIYNSVGTLVGSASTLHGTGADPTDAWIGMQVTLTQEGANVRWETLWHAVGSEEFYTHSPGGSTFAGTAGRFGEVALDARYDANFAGAQFAHVLLTRDNNYLNTYAFANASAGYTSEPAGERMRRLAEEEGLQLDIYGDASLTEETGPQRPDTLLNLLQDAALTDGGVLSEARDVMGFEYRTREYLGRCSPLELDYSAFHLAATPEPVEDDRYLLNDVTVQRPSGSAARWVKESGTKSVLDPPDGVGRYAGGVTRNAADDEQLTHLAQWEVFWRTWDEERVPNLAIALHRAPFLADDALTEAVIQGGVGSAVHVTGLPDFLPPGDWKLLSFGYSEVLESKLWTLVFNTVPRGPYIGHRIDSTAPDEGEPRMDAATGELTLTSGVNTTATSFSLTILNGALTGRRVLSGEDFDMVIGGEVVTFTAATTGAASGSDWTQTATVTRSVNGIVKAHSAGAELYLYQPAYLQLGA